jgi:multidrug efflux pump subunit AcrA (membrane-fusion protein)
MRHGRTEICDFEGSTGLASRQRRILIPLWIAACAMVLSSVGCAHQANTPLIEVDVAKPVRRDVPVYSEWIGTTVGYIDAQIHSKVTGYLLAQNYKEGSLVHTGDLLFEVDPRPFQAVVDQAKGQLDVANAFNFVSRRSGSSESGDRPR